MALVTSKIIIHRKWWVRPVVVTVRAASHILPCTAFDWLISKAVPFIGDHGYWWEAR